MYEFSLANHCDIPGIVALYSDLVGTPGCAWTAEYPNTEIVAADVANGNQYILKKDGILIAAAAIVNFDDLSHLSWNMNNPCELVRVGVRRLMLNQGIGKILMQQVIMAAKNCGYGGICMLVSQVNPAALALYDKMGFEQCGETFAYGGDYFCYCMKFDSVHLNADFYRHPALELAPMLLGKILCRRVNEEITRVAITETEAYCGESDTACHAHRGKTKRTAVMYEPGGVAYVYLCYGIHHLLNVVAAAEGEPEAVLIRGVEGIIGPGRLTKALNIGMDLNREDLILSQALWLEDGPKLPYITGPRVGIGYASEADQARQWRFMVKY